MEVYFEAENSFLKKFALQLLEGGKVVTVSYHQSANRSFKNLNMKEANLF